jgi:hypothetical protein
VADIAEDHQQPNVSSAEIAASLSAQPPRHSYKEQRLRESMILEALHIEESAAIWGTTYRLRAGFWQMAGRVLALAGALTATISGATGLAQGGGQRVFAGILALTAAALGAISTTLTTRARSEEERAAAVANRVLADAARVFHTIVARFAALDTVASAFVILCEQRDRVVAAAPVTLTSSLIPRMVRMRKSRDAYKRENSVGGKRLPSLYRRRARSDELEAQRAE